MKVIICEDDKAQLHLIRTKLENYAFIEYPTIEIVLSTSNPEEVLAYMEHEQADCYFLDIELNSSISGLDLASKIREVDPQSSIIFVTTHAELLQLTFTYKLAALDFIIKTDQELLTQQLIVALEAAYQKYRQLGSANQKQYFQVKMGEFIKNIPFEDIYFFSTSSQAHKIQLQTKNGNFEFYGKLKDLENLNENFYRCHQSYIINLQQIYEIDKKNRIVKMNNGEFCYISYRAIRGLQENIRQKKETTN